MISSYRWIFILAFMIAGCRAANKAGSTDVVQKSLQLQNGTFISQIRQLSFAGRRAGEGYFRADGKYFVFQSERDSKNPFYQIFLTDLSEGATQRVSPGQGKATCAWVHPTERKVLFSSTHQDPKRDEKAAAEWEERKNPKSRYSWSFDDAYDIYETDFNGRKLKALTSARGYDAEASYSPDGKWIAFASNRAGYTEKLNDDEAKAFARDPSYMMDLYIMRSNGTGVKRLTTTRGYDGGPFFSPDGKNLTFRRFSPDGRSAEVFTIGVDGQNEKQITRLKTMSWAPFYHPSGDYLIFTSSLLGHSNFELFIVDVEGKKEPVRVTTLEGFDGLPVFTPDGRTLVWTHADSGGEGQLYQANWNDTSARAALGLQPAVPMMRTLTPEIRAAEAKVWIEYLTQDKFAGRVTGSDVEADYGHVLAEAFKEMGLKPAVGRDYMQTFMFTNGIQLGPKNNLAIQTQESVVSAEIEKDWVPLSDSKTGSVEVSPVVFAGYGIVAPAANGQPAYDSYGDLDVKDKWVLAFTGLPNEVGNERRFHLNIYARMTHKALVARQKGARGLLLVEDSTTTALPLKIKFEGRTGDSGIPVIRISPALAETWMASSSASRKEWTKKLAKGDVFTGELAKVKVGATVDLEFTNAQARNVLALLPAKGAASTIVIGAHMDHLGMGEGGASLAPGTGIHYGADDNASGVAAVMEIAHALSADVKSGKIHLKKNIVFALWSGEEVGILGSNYFLSQNKALKISGYLNLDMVGRLRDRLVVQGVASAVEWRSLLEKNQRAMNLSLSLQDDPYVPSDGLAFYMKGIPSISFFTGSHSEYHTPKDRPELINYQGIEDISNMVAGLTSALAQSAGPTLTYEKVKGSGGPMGGGRGFRLYLGTIPNYSEETKGGVKISGTSKGSPAEKAGLKSGDVILELGGIQIKNIQDYVYCLQALKANEPAKMRVLRAGREVELQVTPVSKVQ